MNLKFYFCFIFIPGTEILKSEIGTGIGPVFVLFSILIFIFILGQLEREHRPSCLISTSGNYANMDLIRQAKVQSYPETNKQFCFCFLFYLDNVVDHCAWAVQYGI